VRLDTLTGTVRAALAALWEIHPAFATVVMGARRRGRTSTCSSARGIHTGGSIRRFPEGSEISIVPAVSGGSPS
jgi:hypothetical protein